MTTLIKHHKLDGLKITEIYSLSSWGQSKKPVSLCQNQGVGVAVITLGDKE